MHCLRVAASYHRCGLAHLVLDGFARRMTDLGGGATVQRARSAWLGSVTDVLAAVMRSDPFEVPEPHDNEAAGLSPTSPKRSQEEEFASVAVQRCAAAAVANAKRRLAEEARIERRRAKRRERKSRKQPRAVVVEEEAELGAVVSVEEITQEEALPPMEDMSLDSRPVKAVCGGMSGMECAICMEDASRRALLSCGCAKICLDCCYEALGRRTSCPTCQSPDVVVERTVFI